MVSKTTPLTVVLVAAFVTLAGCSGFLGDEPTNGTTTIETTTGPGDPPAADQMPPGITEEGIENRSALLAAHRAGLAETGYRTAITVNATLNGSDGVQQFNSSQESTVEEGLAPFHVRSSSQGAFVGTTGDVWGNGSVVLSRQQRGGETSYASPTGPVNESQITSTSTIGPFLAAGDYDVVGTETRDGTDVVLLRATEANDTSSLQTGNVTAFDATVAVDADGIVHAVEGSMTGETQGGTVTMDVRYELLETGDVTVDRPAWIDEALANVTIASVDVGLERAGENGSYVVVTHRSGDTLPANSFVAVTANGTQHLAQLSAPLESGDVRYVHLSPGTDRASVVAEPPSAGNVTGFGDEATVAVLTPTGTQVTNSTVSLD